METVEEGQNRPKICPKRIKLQEIEKGEVDRLSALPEYLILEILSHLPSTEDAIRTGALSKRWKHLWTSIPTLIFTHIDDNLLPRSEFFSFVDKTLTQRPQSKLNKLAVYTLYDISFKSQVNNWIRYAVSCNVEQLILKLYRVSNFECQLDQFVYISSCFTDLTLEGCILNPTGAISWKNLRSLSISNGRLDEDLIENILSGSPVLETLVLNHCYGYRLLNISSKSLKNLVFSGYNNPEDEGDDLSNIIEINAPNILSLTIRGDLSLGKLLLVNVSSLVEANLNYIKRAHYEMIPKEEEEELLIGFILNLCHVIELKIGVCCSEVVSRLEAKEFEFPSNIKFLDGDYERMKLRDWPESESESDSY